MEVANRVVVLCARVLQREHCTVHACALRVTKYKYVRVFFSKGSAGGFPLSRAKASSNLKSKAFFFLFGLLQWPLPTLPLSFPKPFPLLFSFFSFSIYREGGKMIMHQNRVFATPSIPHPGQPKPNPAYLDQYGGCCKRFWGQVGEV